MENCTIRLNSVPSSLSWGLTELGNNFIQSFYITVNVVKVTDRKMINIQRLETWNEENIPNGKVKEYKTEKYFEQQSQTRARGR